MKENAAALRVAILSDVSVGYGTPQILRMAESFAKVFDADVHIFEPDQSERPPIDISTLVATPRVSLTRIYTSAHPYRMEGRIEYCKHVASLLQSQNMNIVIFSTMYGVIIQSYIDLSGVYKIFYGLEDADEHYSYLFPLVRRCDMRIFPEENRRRIYSNRLDITDDDRPTLLFYNSNNHDSALPPNQRNNRLFYGGSFDRDKNFASYFFDSKISQMPIDVYGSVTGFDDNASVAKSMAIDNNGLTYCGYRQSDDAFFQLLSRYLYSIVVWNPFREDYFYACPNKFFDAIACGVPPICAPHPQCVELIRKWNFGILMDDWSFESFSNALTRALKAAGSDYYRELVYNCRRAMDEELSWDRQFEKLVPFVKKHFADKGRSL